MKIQISRDSYTEMAEPYLWYDDRGDDPGWVLRYSLSDEVGQRHLDEPLCIDLDEDADDDILMAAGEETAELCGLI